MIAGIFSFLLKLGFGGVVDKALNHLEKRAELENDKERLKALTTIELAREAVKESKYLADFNKEKLSYTPFWVFLFMVSAPFILWGWAVVLDSIPYLRDLFGEQQVSNLPTPQLQEAFAAMIKWTFFIGSGVGVIKFLRR